jgi:hypothetical protein
VSHKRFQTWIDVKQRLLVLSHKNLETGTAESKPGNATTPLCFQDTVPVLYQPATTQRNATQRNGKRTTIGRYLIYSLPIHSNGKLRSFLSFFLLFASAAHSLSNNHNFYNPILSYPI